MNKTIRHSSIFALLLVFVLLVYLTVIQGFSEERLAQNPYNPRGFYESKEIARGQISADGQVLASSSPDEEGLYQRSYPTMPVSFSPVVGYLSDRFGAAGLESGYNAVLSGQDSEVAASRWLDDLTGKTKRGANLELTVDTGMQEVAYNQLANNGYGGAAVALRPSTGEILAMASTPSYNPNDLVNPATRPGPRSTVIRASHSSTRPRRRRCRRVPSSRSSPPPPASTPATPRTRRSPARPRSPCPARTPS